MTRIALEDSPGETRAVAIDAADRPVSLFLWRDPAIDPRAVVGDIHSAIVRKADARTHGQFLDLDTGETAFFNLKKGETAPPEGAHVNVRIRAEAHADKAVRVELTDDGPERKTRKASLENWYSSVLRAEDAPDELTELEAQAVIDATWEELSAESVPLRNGGHLHIDSTRAMTVIDVDSAGRDIRRKASPINVDAIDMIARQISLRRLGGLVVADLVGAPQGDQAGRLVKTFRTAARHYGLPRVDVLPINRFGLLEISVPRGARPLFPAPSGDEDPEPALEVMRTLKRRLASERTTEVQLKLGRGLYESLGATDFDWRGWLAARFGERFTIHRDDALDETSYVISP